MAWIVDCFGFWISAMGSPGFCNWWDRENITVTPNILAQPDEFQKIINYAYNMESLLSICTHILIKVEAYNQPEKQNGKWNRFTESKDSRKTNRIRWIWSVSSHRWLFHNKWSLLTIFSISTALKQKLAESGWYDNIKSIANGRWLSFNA